MNEHTNYCREKLEMKNLRITPQRLAIYCYLLETKTHPSTDMVYQKIKSNFPNISFDTVNRTLLSFTEKGLVKMIENGFGARRFDADLTKHYHFQCIKCKKIVDFVSPDYDQVKVPEKIKSQFQVLEQKIGLKGICSDCAPMEKSNNQNNQID